MGDTDADLTPQQRLSQLARFLAIGAARVLRRLTRKKTDTARKPSTNGEVSQP